MGNKTETDAVDFVFPMRLVRFLGLTGVASRRKSEEFIAAGEVMVNGETVTEPAFKVSDDDAVTFKGKHLLLTARCYVMLNKPGGYLCSSADPHAEKTIFDLVNVPGKRLFSVGRLDLNSEGLLLLTDDGDFAERLTHPRFGIRKKYLVQTKSPLSSGDINRIEQGLEDDGEKLQADKVESIIDSEYIFTLSEGKKREIRRLVAAVSGRVILLRRLSIGNLELGELPLGKWRFLTPEEVTAAMAK